MSCPKNIKKWWIFKWEGPHEWFTTYFKYSSMWWTESMKCKLCKCNEEVWPLEEVDMIRSGYDIENKRYKSSIFPTYYPYELGVGTKESYDEEYNKFSNKGK